MDGTPELLAEPVGDAYAALPSLAGELVACAVACDLPDQAWRGVGVPPRPKRENAKGQRTKCECPHDQPFQRAGASVRVDTDKRLDPGPPDDRQDGERTGETGTEGLEHQEY
jgi:hypothetical protein